MKQGMAAKRKTEEEIAERRKRRQEKKTEKYGDKKQKPKKIKKIKRVKTAREEIAEIDSALTKKREQRSVSRFLEKRANKDEWKTLRRKDGTKYTLTKEDLDIIKKYTKGMCVDDGIEQFQEHIDFYTQDVLRTEAKGGFEKKTRFVHSEAEKKQIKRLVKVMREGKPRPEKKEVEEAADLWERQAGKRAAVQRIAPPRQTAPATSESYNPPKEFQLTAAEVERFESTVPEERPYSHVPQCVGAMRKIPVYADYFDELYGRCMDLYLSTREIAQKIDITAESLVPKKENTDGFRPFPETLKDTIQAHKGRTLSMAVDRAGQWLVTCGEDNALRVWETETGLMTDETLFEEDVLTVEWCPRKGSRLVAVGLSSRVLVVDVGLLGGDDDVGRKVGTKTGSGSSAVWVFHERARTKPLHVVSEIRVSNTKRISWHYRGASFVTCSSDNSKKKLALHTLSDCRTEFIFTGIKSKIGAAVFHPSESTLFVATQKEILVYNLKTREKVKTVLPELSWISEIAVSQKSGHVVSGSFDGDVSWADYVAETDPCKKLTHKGGVKSISFSQKYPLVACGGGEGLVDLFHTGAEGKLSLVPLARIGGKKKGGVTQCLFHPTQPWLFVCGASGEVFVYI
ncbi:MAG: WD repeat/BOP1NT protein [Amphiamblys sp. WSBS2006]|nr:MAG: WD repeat/BOP1NT protein [Amphiamblys sp. WSBS2006]